MKTTHLLAGLVAAGALAAAGYGLYAVGMQRGMGMAPAVGGTAGGVPQGLAQGEAATRRHIAAGIKAGDIDPANGRKILHYHDPMVPGNKFDKPARSPFMDMMLVPAYEDKGSGNESGNESGNSAGQVSVSPRMQQNLGLRTAPVVEGSLAAQLAAVGSIAWNERDQVVVQARAAGFVERLHVRATLDRVTKGQPLVELYVPEWIAAQEEFLVVRRMQGSGLADIADAARSRMRQLGMSEAQIALVEGSGRSQPRISFAAPIGGVVTELLVREGMSVAAGATLVRINGTATVWANAEVPESQAASLRPGARVRAHSPAAPGAVFEGRVQALLPEVNPTTRTRKARVELANPGARLVPGMFVQMQFIEARAAKVLLVPTEAVIATGTRSVVMLAEGGAGGSRFRPVEVETGREAGGQTEIRRGLQPGQTVVVSAQFLIDSEASLKGVEARLNAAGEPAAASAPRHRSEAKVEHIGSDSLTLSHGPIPALQWGSMTMDFKRPEGALPGALAVGDAVDFEFFIAADGTPQISALKVLARGPTAAPRAAASAAAARSRP